MDSFDLRIGSAAALAVAVVWWLTEADASIPPRGDHLVRMIVVAVLAFAVGGALGHVVRCWYQGRYDRMRD